MNDSSQIHLAKFMSNEFAQTLSGVLDKVEAKHSRQMLEVEERLIRQNEALLRRIEAFESRQKSGLGDRRYSTSPNTLGTFQEKAIKIAGWIFLGVAIFASGAWVWYWSASPSLVAHGRNLGYEAAAKYETSHPREWRDYARKVIAHEN